MDTLDPAGLYLYVIVGDTDEVESLRPWFGM